jgi:hypothetical protein
VGLRIAIIVKERCFNPRAGDRGVKMRRHVDFARPIRVMMSSERLEVTTVAGTTR